MKTRLILLAAAIAAFAAPAAADLVEVRADFDFQVNDIEPPIALSGIGIATVNGSAGGSHITTFAVPASIVTGSGTVVVTDPIVSGTIPDILLRTVANDGGTFQPVSTASTGGLTQDELGFTGLARVCLVVPGCISGSLDAPLQESVNGVVDGFGIGGLITIGRLGSIRISVVNGPWTLHTASHLSRTGNMGITLRTVMGAQHGPASSTSSTAQTSGVLQFVTASQNQTIGIPGNNDVGGLRGSLRFHIVPEPGLLLLLGTGAVGLAILGRSRLKR